jgi:gliding motility-associated-like protein
MKWIEKIRMYDKTRFLRTRKICRYLLVATMLVLLKVNAFSQGYTLVTTAIPALTNAKAKWVDFNKDGQVDLFISGTTSMSALHTAIYLNNGNNTFTVISFTGLTDLAFDVGDYDRNGFIDIILAGIDAGGLKKTSVFKNNNGISFTEQTFSLTPLSKGGIVWRDLNNDGYLDILMTGLTSANQEKTLVYAGSASGYEAVSHELPAVSNGALISFDATNDGLQEVLLTGLTSEGTAISTVYKINSDFAFSPFSELPSVFSFNSIAASDYNNDGFTDLFLSGLSGDDLQIKTALFQNNTLNGFNEIPGNLQDLSAASLSLGDLNTDGLLDVVASGIDDASNKYFLYYNNTPAYAFVNANLSLPNIYNGQSALADYDNDGDLDIFQIGNSDISLQANLYKSDQAVSIINQVPAAPTTLGSTVTNSSVELTWATSTDNFTNTASLTYNLYISKNPAGSNLVVSPLSDLTTGKRHVVENGNTGYATSTMFNSLPEGRYYWSVQAIDNGYAGSAFSTEQSFAICNPISLGPDTTICYGNEIQFNTGQSVDVVNWYSKAGGLLAATTNTFSYTVLQTDTIIVELTRPFNCTVRDTVIVTVAPLPVIDLGEDEAVCLNSQLNFEIPSTIDSVNWLSINEVLLLNSRSYVHTAYVKDTIIVQAFSALKCVNYDSIVVDVLPLPSFTLGDDKSSCSQQDVQLEVTGNWPMVNWRSLQTGSLANATATFLLTVIQTDTIEAEVMDVNGCKNYDSIRVEMLSLPVADLGNDRSICLNESTLFELLDNGNTVNWYTFNNLPLATGQNSYLLEVNRKDTLVVEVIDGNSCVQKDTVIVNAIALPVVNLGPDTAICFEDNILLNAGAGFQRVDWYSKKSSTPLVENSFFFDYTVKATDTLVVKVQSTAGCINYDSIRIEMKPLPLYSLGTDRNVCERDTAKLEITGTWEEVGWYTAGNILLEPNSNSYEFVVEQTLSLWTVVKGLNGCVKNDTVTVNTLSLPVFDLGDDRVNCAGDQVSLGVSVANATSYTWTNSDQVVLSSTGTYNFTASTPQRIYLRIEDQNQCHYADSVFSNVNPLPDFDIDGLATVCEGEETTLSIAFDTWQSIEWYREATTILESGKSTFSITPQNTSEFFAKLTDSNSCSSIRSKLVTVNNRPIAAAGDDALLCYGESVALGDANADVAGLTFQWSPSTGLSNPKLVQPIAEPLATTTYTLTVTDENGCSGTDEVYIELNPEIVVDAGANASVCIGDSFTLGGQPTAAGSNFPYSYQWSSDAGIITGNESNPVIAPTQSDIYYVFVSSGRCEVVYDSIVITVHPLPMVTVSGDQSIGAGASVMLSATGGSTYNWLPAESLDNNTIASPQASPQVTTLYTVVVTDGNGCSANAQVKLIVQNSLFIPTLFTPNGDGANDTFILYGSGVASLKFSIHDKNGNAVYYTEDVQQAFATGWDGISQGKPVTSDIYFWSIEGEFFTGEKISLEGKNRGIIKLMR